MFGGKTRNDADDGRELNTILGKGSVIEGKISIKNSVRVDGKLIGDISSTGTVTVGEKGEVEGTINAVRAIVGGKVKGRINASAKAILEAQSVFIGDLKTAKLTIDEGAMFEGRCLMNDEEMQERGGRQNNGDTKETKDAGKQEHSSPMASQKVSSS